jgi:hypothetical protein
VDLAWGKWAQAPLPAAAPPQGKSWREREEGRKEEVREEGKEMSAKLFLLLLNVNNPTPFVL